MPGTFNRSYLLQKEWGPGGEGKKGDLLFTLYVFVPCEFYTNVSIMNIHFFKKEDERRMLQSSVLLRPRHRPHYKTVLGEPICQRVGVLVEPSAPYTLCQDAMLSLKS